MLRETIVFVVAIKLAVFVAFGFYQRWWRYVSTRDMWRAVLGVAVASVLAIAAVYFFYPVERLRLPRGVALVDPLLLLAFVAGSRLLARTVIERPKGGIVARGRKVLIVGAGDAGRLIVQELQRSKVVSSTPVGLIDDDPRKRGMRLLGVRVLGTTDDLPHILRDNRPDEVLIAVPSAPGEFRRRIVEMASAERVPVKTLPGLHELIAGDLGLATQIRPVQVEDVLGREPVEIDLPSVASYLAGKTVLVTGAGGSIGSELCRQIARVQPARLVLVDSAETPLFEIERELVEEREFPASVPVLADCGNRAKLRQVFERYRPDVVFHAAAYKHVPLMEANPVESVRNNVLASRCVADVAVEFGAERFVLVSTDKAVNPKTVMGQSKALCEWVVETYGHRDDVPTRFVAVRFGNVLGSSGSVVPIFRRQLERGGPLTVTHPEMTRYFMTIPEASSLVVQAGRDRRPRRGLRARHGRARSDHRPGGEHDPPLGPQRRADRVRRHEARREAARGALERGRDRAPHAVPEDLARDPGAGRPRLAPGRAERAGAARRRGGHARARLAPDDDRQGACARIGTDPFDSRHTGVTRPAGSVPRRLYGCTS